MKYAQHITAQNDRWDTISSKYYGTPFNYTKLFMANPDIQKHFVLPDGIKIKVPLITENDKEGINLPPWKDM